MAILKTGSSGAAVKALQTKLKLAGFSPGAIDGKFGEATKNAVIAFQKSKNLTADGLAGPKTMEALSDSSTPDSGDNGRTPLSSLSATVVVKMFPGTPLTNIETNLPFVMAALAAASLDDKDMVLMALATIRAETGNFTPLSEFKSKFNTSPNGHPFNKYDNRKDLGNIGPPDGEQFRGRGYIQLTGRANYKEHGAAIGLGNKLIEDPTLANKPDIAARLLASFLKSKEQAIRKALAVGDLRKARKLVNGGSHGLPQFSQAFKVGQTVID